MEGLDHGQGGAGCCGYYVSGERFERYGSDVTYVSGERVFDVS